jgi:hypothetical protein
MSPRRNWDSPNHSLTSERAPPPRTGGGTHSPAGEGLEESQFRRLEKKLSTLPTLCLKVSDSRWIVAGYTFDKIVSHAVLKHLDGGARQLYFPIAERNGGYMPARWQGHISEVPNLAS